MRGAGGARATAGVRAATGTEIAEGRNGREFSFFLLGAFLIQVLYFFSRCAR